MRLVANRSVVMYPGFPYSNQPHFALAISFLNELLQDKQSFLHVFMKIAAQFLDKEKYPDHSIDEDYLYERSLAIGNVTVSVLKLDDSNSEYYEKTITERCVKDKVITIAARYISAEVDLANLGVKVLYLFLILLHECCHLLTAEFRLVANPRTARGNEMKSANRNQICEAILSSNEGNPSGAVESSEGIPSEIGRMIPPGHTEAKADCGLGLEYALFGAGSTVTLKDAEMLSLYSLRIIDLNRPAKGENLRRFRIPREIVQTSYNQIKSWHDEKAKCCFCRYGHSLFPLGSLEAFSIERLPQECELSSAFPVSLAVDFGTEYKSRIFYSRREKVDSNGNRDGDGCVKLPEIPTKGGVVLKPGVKR